MEPTAARATSWRSRRSWLWAGAGAVLVLCAIVLGTMWWWDSAPPLFDPIKVTQTRASDDSLARERQALPEGAVTTATLMASVRVLLEKRGGYLSNDKLPPGAFLDNMPNWEFGSLTASRDLARALRNEFSRSQTQSTEDTDLAEADPLLSSPSDRWLFPSSESQYRKAIAHLDGYFKRLGNGRENQAKFYARADNLADYLQLVSSRMGSLSQRLSASVGPVGAGAAASTGDQGPDADARVAKTPWTKIDDNFYEARGYTWTLLEQLRAIQHDFAPILKNKNAQASFQQVIRELEEAQHGLSSPMVLNGSPFGLFANHSLVMANYVSRANAAIIELRQLLARG